MKLSDCLGKSTGENLISHTDKVMRNTLLLGDKYGIEQFELDILKYSAILHDIGKVSKPIQIHFKTGKSLPKKLKFAHNILGWYFITQFVNLRDKDKIANLVLWHHANHNSCNDLPTKIDDIAKEISEEELRLMFEFCEHYNIPTYSEESEEDIEDNTYYKVDNLLRAILVTSDVCASTDKNVLELFHSKSIELSELDSDFVNSPRTQNQLDIVYQILNDTTTLVKAPTGFGKTILGLLFTLRQSKQVVWVCPTNIIASSIYHDVIEAMNMMGFKMTVELYLTGEIQKTNSDSNGFESKLIITNIDNFTKPSVSNSYGERCLLIYDCPVIFDEPHEYDSMDCALNASYNNIMSVRHNFLHSTTLLLTATPRPIRFKKLGMDDIHYLPNVNSHYGAKHTQPYKVFFHDTTPNLTDENFVMFSHTVDDVQNNYRQHSGDKLIAHGRYLDEDKEYRKNLVLENYGKSGQRIPHAVFTNQILTTACDYSVNKMYIKSPTIWEFYQALGRLNRFGDMDSAEIHIILDKTKADSIHIGQRDENQLQELFINELQIAFPDGEFILDELYQFYNMFNDKHSDLLNSISKQNLRDSKEMLKRVFPKKTKDSGVIVNGNKMRQSPTADGIYVSAKRVDSNEFVTLNFNLNKHIGYQRTFDETHRTIGEQIKVLKLDPSFNKYIPLTSEILQRQAIFFDTPYIIFNYQYCNELGLIKQNNLDI